ENFRKRERSWGRVLDPNIVGKHGITGASKNAEVSKQEYMLNFPCLPLMARVWGVHVKVGEIE
ncbi:hypothetical protein HAX54_034469, partial [Datura stramonium]|nr:hypothetical protein [Datura stramonium]